ncbi:MAG: hypothetical protein VW339_14075, partial [Quisquiliibacterium sp.]
CGLPSVHRIERGIVYRIAARKGLLGAEKEFSEASMKALAGALHDRMTETASLLAPDPAQMFASLPGKPMRRIAVIAKGRDALHEANQSLGLA